LLGFLGLDYFIPFSQFPGILIVVRREF
jgi:hypothetical protein